MNPMHLPWLQPGDPFPDPAQAWDQRQPAPGLLAAGGADWLLDTRGLAVGDTFVISAEVPEPSTFALMLPALCMAGMMAARRRKQG